MPLFRSKLSPLVKNFKFMAMAAAVFTVAILLALVYFKNTEIWRMQHEDKSMAQQIESRNRIEAEVVEGTHSTDASGYPMSLVETFRSHLSRTDPVAQPRKLFSDVLLVVQFNSNNRGKFEDASRLRAVYGVLFDEIVFTGSPVLPWDSDGSYDHGNPFGVLLCPGAERGLMAYQCLNEVMSAFPGRRGYMMVHFDVLVNWPAVVDLPRDSLWIQGNQLKEPYRPVCNWVDVDLSREPYYLWKWGDYIGPGNWHECVNPFTNIPCGAKAVWKFLDTAPPSLQENYHKKCFSGNITDTCGATVIYPENQMADVVYVPSRFVAEFQEVSQMAYAAHLSLEFALSAIMYVAAFLSLYH